MYCINTYIINLSESNTQLKNQENSTMRKVLYSKYIPYQGYEKEMTNEGIFHQFSISYEEFDNGIAQYPVGIIEEVDGSITHLPLHYFKFKEPLVL